jgi:hypothetical protein
MVNAAGMGLMHGTNDAQKTMGIYFDNLDRDPLLPSE